MDPQLLVLFSNAIDTTFEKILLPYLKKLHGLAKGEIEKLKIDWNIAFKEYLTQSYNKYSKIKTLLFKTEPKFIYDFFEPPLLSYNGKTITTDIVTTIFQDSHFLIIKGEGGMGKSTLLKHLFINTIQETEQIPIFLELLDFNDASKSIAIFDLINQKLSKLGCHLDEDLLKYALTSGCFVFFLDGYDELIPERRNAFFTELDSFCDKYSTNYFVMTSRPFSDFIEFQRFTVLTCERLTIKQAISLISKINPYDEKVKERFISDLSTTLFRSHYEFASNPLLLNIMFLTYDHYATLPVKRHIFYDYAYETMFHLHDATKGVYKRLFMSGVPSDQFKKIISHFCYISYAKGKVEMSKDEVLLFLSETHARCGDFDEKSFMDDLLNSVCFLFRDGLVYKFIHRSFQEYFVALFLIELTDEILSNIAKKLINSDSNLTISDDVLLMFGDMAKERFENSILMPYLRIIDEKVDPAFSKYDQYYEILFRGVSITHTSGKVDGLAVAIQDVFLCRIIAQNYRSGNRTHDYRVIESILHGIIKADEVSGDALTFSRYSIDEMKANGLFEAIKTTWIGDDVNRLSTLLAELEEKHRKLNTLPLDF